MAEGIDDDVGEGVDALLSLASLAHASSSAHTDSQPPQGEEGAAAAAGSYRSRSAGRSRAGRSASLKAHGRPGSARAAAAAAAAGGEEGGEEGAGGDYWSAFEAAAAAVEAAERAGDGSSEDVDVDEAAAGGLAQMRGSQGNFFSTPQKRGGSGALQVRYYDAVRSVQQSAGKKLATDSRACHLPAGLQGRPGCIMGFQFGGSPTEGHAQVACMLD